MIVSASRRTDIPAYYTDWMLSRIKERYVCVKNPMNPRQVSRIDLSPDGIDCLVFWSKNPKPMLEKLKALGDYTYYFQFTLNPYGRDIETNLPDKNELVETFKKLSDMTGPKKVIWRYDPVLINASYTVQYHIDNFYSFALKLKGYTTKVTFSFMDFYKKISLNIGQSGIKQITEDEMDIIAKNFSLTAQEAGLAIGTCAEETDLSKYGIGHASCIDAGLISELTGTDLYIKKDKSQRPACACAASVDIGEYNSCLNGCIYCYANYSQKNAKVNNEKHDVSSPLLIGSFIFPELQNNPKG